MTKLPERNVLDGSKTPKTTTGEMKEALAAMRNYLADLLGVDSNDKTAARQALGVEEKLNAKADMKTVEALQEEISKRGTPVGSIDYFATTTPPSGYLKADGAAVGRETYPELFSAIGTMFGSGDETTTFNLPDLMGRFPEGSETPGVKKEAGLPNITGSLGMDSNASNGVGVLWGFKGAFLEGPSVGPGISNYTIGQVGYGRMAYFSANCSSGVYRDDVATVQPPALTLLPCIKAFDAIAHPGLIDVSRLAQEVSGKVDRMIGEKPIQYIVNTYRNDTGWYRQWSDGWVEQGGYVVAPATGQQRYSFLLPMADTGYTVTAQIPVGSYYFIGAWPWSNTHFSYQGFGMDGSLISEYGFRWHAFGQGA